MALGKLVAIRDLAALAYAADLATASLARGYCVSSQYQTLHQAVPLHQTAKRTGSNWRYWSAASAAAGAGFAFWLASTSGPARCLIESAELDDQETDPPAASLREWLATFGGDLDAIDIRESVDVGFYVVNALLAAF